MKLIKTVLAVFCAASIALGLASFGMTGMAHADGHTDMADHGTMHVTKSPTCGCCGAWVALARKEGYEVEVTDTRDVTTVKRDAGIPGDLWACHTAMIDGYVVEGHMPFEALEKLLTERPEIAGIAVPGMPGGSPGMGDDPSARYDVIAFGGDAGEGEVFYQAGL
ncbi:DUF411 domain-containing protein [Yoonia sediminilitoris]|uniref:CopG family transcriptional regulator n=1 Tax=Yoonia sediminilitoris TaxID=1286148 RepID=A0A2T6K0W4_9RHOB|nr:DUF411 domain-containing protein [Yoonia sediminilitoris]PUB08236.1 hypothetical protein C8N45_1442 [Yoonia sediminilitoris]RCW89405.1 hypothetical protein DFP92_1432 [Yoonia sediminilitoris]